MSSRCGSKIGLQEESKYWEIQLQYSETMYTEILSLISRFKQPYPKTHWCSIPVEDKTNKQLCRPLPVDRIPPPPRLETPGNSLRHFLAARYICSNLGSFDREIEL